MSPNRNKEEVKQTHIIGTLNDVEYDFYELDFSKDIVSQVREANGATGFYYDKTNGQLYYYINGSIAIPGHMEEYDGNIKDVKVIKTEE